jgi:hypothetical protein
MDRSERLNGIIKARQSMCDRSMLLDADFDANHFGRNGLMLGAGGVVAAPVLTGETLDGEDNPVMY